jgi:hypothetical protein
LTLQARPARPRGRGGERKRAGRALLRASHPRTRRPSADWSRSRPRPRVPPPRRRARPWSRIWSLATSGASPHRERARTGVAYATLVPYGFCALHVRTVLGRGRRAWVSGHASVFALPSDPHFCPARPKSDAEGVFDNVHTMLRFLRMPRASTVSLRPQSGRLDFTPSQASRRRVWATQAAEASKISSVRMSACAAAEVA